MKRGKNLFSEDSKTKNYMSMPHLTHLELKYFEKAGSSYLFELKFQLFFYFQNIY